MRRRLSMGEGERSTLSDLIPVRMVARPEPRVAELLHSLGLSLPVRNRVMEGVEEAGLSKRRHP